MKVRLELIFNGGCDERSIDAIIGSQPGIHVERPPVRWRGRQTVEVVAESALAIDQLCRVLVFDGHVEHARAIRIDWLPSS
ncbi:hypothetical protein [Paraburkholderia caribensis]|uniref:hypothetical protein n=1 Tax=Paraburkholderia caribensis TaxID=75105 RepID=UPI0015902602|nr:hypothetical protein [Paraburkholderia caribensis]